MTSEMRTDSTARAAAAAAAVPALRGVFHFEMAGDVGSAIKTGIRIASLPSEGAETQLLRDDANWSRVAPTILSLFLFHRW